MKDERLVHLLKRVNIITKRENRGFNNYDHFLEDTETLSVNSGRLSGKTLLTRALEDQHKYRELYEKRCDEISGLIIYITNHEDYEHNWSESINDEALMPSDLYYALDYDLEMEASLIIDAHIRNKVYIDRLVWEKYLSMTSSDIMICRLLGMYKDDHRQDIN